MWCSGSLGLLLYGDEGVGILWVGNTGGQGEGVLTSGLNQNRMKSL